MMSQTDKEMVRGAIILTYAGLLSKVLSAFYRIPLQNITGDVGFYIYQQIYPFIGMMTMLMLYGLPQSIAALVIEKPIMRQYKRQMRIFLYSVCFSLFIVLFMMAPMMSEWMGDASLVSSLRAAFLLLFVLPELSLQRGLDQASGLSKRTAISQVLEQLFRVSIIITGAILVVRLNLSLYDIGVVASLGAITGGLVALIYFYVQKKHEVVLPVTESEGDHVYRELMKPLLIYSVIIAMNHMILLLLQWVDAFTLVELLQRQGVDLLEAKQLKGILDRAQPLSQLGIVASSSITLALVPGLSRATKAKNTERFIHLAELAYRYGLYLSGAATVGLIILMPKVNLVLFKDTAGTVSIQIFVVAIVFTSLAIIISSILQAIGKGRQVIMALVGGMVVKYFANQWLVPVFFLRGAAVSTALSSLTIFIVNYYLLKQHLKAPLHVPLMAFISSLIALMVCVLGLDYVLSPYLFMSSRIAQFIYLLGVIVVGVFVYGLSLIKTGAITTEERTQLFSRKK